MTLCIVPARGGSVGIPGKNLRKVAGRTLLGWAITSARSARFVDEVVVSTDSEAIAEEARSYGASIVVRPPDLATSTATLDAALRHCLDAMTFDGTVVLLQPTVPYRRAGLVDECITRLEEAQADSLLTASRLHFVWTADGRPLVPTRANRQDMPRGELLFHEDGAVFVFRARLLRETGSRVGGKVLVVENEATVDVDTPEDLVLAEALLRARALDVLQKR